MGNERLGQLFKALGRFLKKAKEECSRELVIALCLLLTTIFVSHLRGIYLGGGSFKYVENLLEIFENCNFDTSAEFDDAVAQAKSAIGSI